MIALDRPTLVLQAALASATGTTQPVVTVISRTITQQTKSTFEEYQSRVEMTVITGATPITVSCTPAVNSFKAIQYIAFVNRSTDTESVTFSLYDGTTRYEQITQSLTTNQGLFYEENRGWYLVTADGGGGTGTVGFITQLVENFPILLPDTLSGDGTYAGIAEAGILGETLSFGYCVYLKTDGKWWKAKSDAASTSAWVKLGMIVVGGSADAAGRILLWGVIRADSLFPTFTVGGAVGVSDATAGLLLAVGSLPLTTTDHVTLIVGQGKTADILYFNPSNDYETHI